MFRRNHQAVLSFLHAQGLLFFKVALGRVPVPFEKSLEARQFQGRQAHCRQIGIQTALLAREVFSIPAAEHDFHITATNLSKSSQQNAF